MHSGDVSCDVEAQPREQGRERAVQVVAVAPAAAEDPAGGGERVDAGRFAEDDVQRLVRHLLEVRALQRAKRVCIDVAGPEVEPETVEIGDRDVVGERLDVRRHRRTASKTSTHATSHASPRNAPASTSET